MASPSTPPPPAPAPAPAPSRPKTKRSHANRLPHDALKLTPAPPPTSAQAPPKYHCPRCSTRTCSLPCYKRHQRQAQCSGKRDPAAYLARAQLATPAALDHDFNFLSGLERAFDAADRDADRRGISLLHAGAPRATAPAAGSNLERRLRECGVLVERAPKGLSRERNNNTRWHAK